MNYVKSSIDRFKFYQRVLNVSTTRVTISLNVSTTSVTSWLHYHIFVALTQFLQVNETVISVTKS